MNSTHLTEMEIDESKANEPTFVLFGCWKEQRMGPNTIDGVLLFCAVLVAWCLVAGTGAVWVRSVRSSSSFDRSRARRARARAKQEDGRRLGRFIRQPAAGSAAPAFFQVIPNGETRAREEHQPLQREQACRTTARNYFGDNLPVSILWGRFGRPLSRSRGPPAISTRAGTHSQALSSLRGNVPAFDPS